MTYQHLKLDSIDFSDERFRISLFPVLDSLMESIARIGLVHPLTVVHREGKICLASGWKRALACREMKLEKIPVLFLKEKQDLAVFFKAVYENLSFRLFSVEEKAEIIRKLGRFGIDNRALQKEYCPLLDIPASLAALEQYRKIAALDDDTKAFIAEHSFSFPVVRRLMEIQPLDISRLGPILVPLGQNKKKQLLEDLTEVAAIKKISPLQILQEKNVIPVLENEKLNPVQKADGVRLWLHRQRYPEYFAWKDDFDTLVRNLIPPRGLSIQASPYFEEDQISIDFRFGNSKEFRDKLEYLNNLASRPEWQKLVKRFGDGQS